jgi:hypothetical protein
MSQIRPARPVLLLDPAEEPAERGVIRRVTGEDLVGEREAGRGDDERHHHLHAVRPLVPAVPNAPFVLLRKRRIALEVGAGQVVEQDLVGGVEQGRPAGLEVGKQLGLVREELVEAAVERILPGDPEVLAEEIRHGTPVEPEPVQAPLAAGIEQAVDGQGLQDTEPACPFPRGGQAVLPEGVEVQRPPELQGEPAGPPLPRADQLQAVEPDLHGGTLRRRLPVGGEEGQLDAARAVERLDRAAPAGLLGVVDLAQVEHGLLHRAAAPDSAVLDDTPVPVLLAVLPPNGGA